MRSDPQLTYRVRPEFEEAVAGQPIAGMDHYGGEQVSSRKLLPTSLYSASSASRRCSGRARLGIPLSSVDVTAQCLPVLDQQRLATLFGSRAPRHPGFRQSMSRLNAFACVRRVSLSNRYGKLRRFAAKRNWGGRVSRKTASENPRSGVELPAVRRFEPASYAEQPGRRLHASWA
jgi:hypothetical protein